MFALRNPPIYGRKCLMRLLITGTQEKTHHPQPNRYKREAKLNLV